MAIHILYENAVFRVKKLFHYYCTHSFFFYLHEFDFSFNVGTYIRDSLHSDTRKSSNRFVIRTFILKKGIQFQTGNLMFYFSNLDIGGLVLDTSPLEQPK